MKKNLALLLVCLVFIAAKAQKNEQSILNGRFYITFPDGAKNVAMRGDIMGPDPNENNQTRIMYDEGNKRLVFFARDLKVKTVNNLAEVVNKQSNPGYPFTVQEMPGHGASKPVLITPQKFDTTKNAILVKTMIVENADGTLCNIGAYLNPAAFADKVHFMQIVQDAFSSVRHGERLLSIKARVDTAKIRGSNATLQITLPDGYVLTNDNGDDFEVFRIEKLGEYGSNDNTDMLVYFGYYPSMLAHEYQLEDNKTADTKGDFMFRTAVWNNYAKPGIIYLREQVFDDNHVAPNMKIHIGLTSTKPEGIEELFGIVKKLLIVYGKDNKN
jgi:hypothetical protein